MAFSKTDANISKDRWHFQKSMSILARTN